VVSAARPAWATRVDDLASGQSLVLVPEPTNKINPRAVIVGLDSQARLGWVPDPLADYANAVLDSGTYTLSVVRANPVSVGPHLRLLVQLAGRVTQDYAPFRPRLGNDRVARRRGRGARMARLNAGSPLPLFSQRRCHALEA
jgi:hypothetical protein